MDAREKLETVLGEIPNSLSEFRTIINTIPALAWSSLLDCSVDFVNRRWEEFTGLTLDNRTANVRRPPRKANNGVDRRGSEPQGRSLGDLCDARRRLLS